jgi:uncharacterized protein (DUF1778 family)
MSLRATPGTKPKSQRPVAAAKASARPLHDVADPERIVLTEREFRTFIAALAKPPKPNQRLLAAAYRYGREVESRP